MRSRTLALTAASACSRAVMTRVPAGIEPVTGFDAAHYMGRWHEIARLDHRFERGMAEITDDYALNPDGTVRVRNPGRRGGEQRSIDGTARFPRRRRASPSSPEAITCSNWTRRIAGR